MKFSKKLKKVAAALSFLMVFQVAFSQLIPTNSASAATTQVKFAVTGEPKVGNIINIAVNVSNVNAIYGAAVDFKYDPTVLEVQSITKGNCFGNAEVEMPVQQIKNGEANIALTMTGDKPGVTVNGTIATIKAKVLKGPATVNLNVTNSNDDLTVAGNNVRVKLSNNASAPVSYTSTNSSIEIANPNPELPAKITSLTSSINVGLANTPMTFTATANRSDVQFEFYTQKNGGKWFKSQTWGTKNTLTWTPGAAGDYKVRVRVRAIGTTASADYKDLSFKVTNGPIQTSKLTSLTSNVITGTAGQPMVFTALADPQSTSYFEFYTQKNGGEWFKSQTWGTKNKLTWTPGRPGTYKVRVRVKNINSINKSDDYKDLTFIVK